MAAVLAPLSARERWLLALAGLTALAVVDVKAFQWAGAQRDRYQVAQADLALARQRRAAQDRDQLDAFDRAQLAALSGWSEHGRNLWLVRVRIEQRIVAAAQAAGLANIQVRLAEAPEGDAATPLLRAEVTGPYVSGPVVAFLKRLASDPKTFALDEMEVNTADAPEFKLALLFPIQIDAQGQAR